MNEAELQSWLVEEGIRDELAQLARQTVRAELDNLVDESEAASIVIDWPRLLLAGSILARSKMRTHQEAALRIATGAVTLAAVQQFKDAGAVLFNKLSNFRAVELAGNRELLPSNVEGRLGMCLRIESQRKQMDNAVLVQSSGEWLQVNDFQKRFWNEANTRSWVSASAPTASGKTFVVLQWLVDRMRCTVAKVAVYLAPTRALVAEIEGSLLSLVGKSEHIQVSSLPTRDKFDAVRSGGPSLILVFTQERLHLLANSLRDAFLVDILIVDEAHKIGDSQRGVILQDAIERVSRANPSLKVAFIAPGTENPEELLADAPVDAEDAAAVDCDSPTVLQNLILVEQVPRKPKLWNLSLRQERTSLPLGILQLASSPSNLRKRLAFIAAAIGERGGTLVYVNGAAESEAVAGLISQLIPSVDESELGELAELADLARKTVHPHFALAPLVERGVAFHYGNMPSLIRFEIERLFKCGKIRFLVCTSTLIEGVNLSCRTIVLRAPRKGVGHAMEPHDFWNLAGRAGRWGNEFQGNIVCIDPSDRAAWPRGVPQRARYSIERESDAVLGLGDGIIEYLSDRANVGISEFKGAEQFEHVGGYLLATYLRLGSIAGANFAKRHPADTLIRLDQSLATIAEQIEVSAEVAGRHPGVSAIGLQRLLDAFRAYAGDPENLLPAAVESQDSYDRFSTIMRRINEHLYPAFLPPGLIPLHALIVVQWLKGFSLASMIRKNVDYHKSHKRPFKLSVLIRETMAFVEQTARFRAPKYFSAYMDVLHIHLREIQREDLVDDSLDIGTQLEFGVSSRTLLSLIELGLSRTSAVSLYEKIARDDLTKEDCLAWVVNNDSTFDGMDIPTIILREIRQKLLRVKPEPIYDDIRDQ